MAGRALITTAKDVPTHLRTWATVGLDEHKDLILIVGEPDSPHEEIHKFAEALGIPTLYVGPEEQARWAVSKSFDSDTEITQRVNAAILDALDWGAKSITLVGADVYPMNLDFFERTDSALRGSTPHWLVSSDTGWWNAGSLLDPPVTLRGFPLSQRHEIPQLTRQTELDDPLRVGVLVHQMLGEPDINAVERITTNPEVKRNRSDTNVVLAPGTWCPFGAQATTVTRELAPLLFIWPYVGRYGDIWAGYLTQRVMQELGRHVAFGFPVVRRDRKQPSDPISDLSDEMIGMRRTERVVEDLRTLHFTGAANARNYLHQGFEQATKSLLLGREAWGMFIDFLIDLDRVP